MTTAGSGPTGEPPKQIDPKMMRLMYVINKLCIKAAGARNQEELIFTIVNDTIAMGHYDRALLWDLRGKKPKIIGVSGQAKFPQTSKLVKKWHKLLEQFEDPAKPQLQIIETKRSEEDEESHKSTVIWLPININEVAELGLWLELWHEPTADEIHPTGMIRLLTEMLLPAYGLAWERLSRKIAVKVMGLTRQQYGIILMVILIMSFVIRLPLRVVAPVEIVPTDPVIVTAPLEGIIEEIVVRPGQDVRKGEILFEYDKRVPLQELRVAQKNVEVLQSELNRASTLGLNEQKWRTEYSIIKHKLEKEKANLDFAKYQASRLSVESPESGVVMVENPDQWRGKPVQVGEKVLSVNDPHLTKVKMWIPEADNFPIDDTKAIKIFLNIDPLQSYHAQLSYISDESMVNEKQVTSFLAEAEWVDPPKNVKLGLKGTAFLYGERVSLFYFVFRKPWRYIRNFVGF